jgi:hypothetical protein
MTTDEVVVDVSQDWVLACDVQQRFMHGPGRNSPRVTPPSPGYVPGHEIPEGWGLVCLRKGL